MKGIVGIALGMVFRGRPGSALPGQSGPVTVSGQEGLASHSSHPSMPGNQEGRGCGKRPRPLLSHYCQSRVMPAVHSIFIV